MATKSITKRVVIDNDEACEKLLNAIEHSRKNPCDIKVTGRSRDISGEEFLQLYNKMI